MSTPLKPPLQLDFFLGVFPELVTVEEACDALDDMHPETVLGWIDEGRLHAVDIARPDVERRCIRVWKYSISHYLIDPTTPPQRLKVSSIMKHGRLKATCVEIATWTSCSVDHIWALHDKGVLEGPRYSKRSRRIFTESYHRWLEDRWIV